jgi:hypothetical protein
MTSYFHSAPLLLEPGSIIQPGNWGRILNCYRQPHANNGWILARELAFESIRAAEFPNSPSRLSCAFVFETLEHANQYKNQFSPWNPLYEVELVNPDAVSHRAAFNLIKFVGDQTEFLPVVVAWARSYWRGEQIEVPELLTTSALRVKHMVSSGPGSYQP